MSGYHNDVMMQREHRQDLLNESHLDRLAREARGGRRDRANELASNLISRLGCLLVGWGKGIRQGSRRSIGPVGTVLAGAGLRLNEVAAGRPGSCECCV